MKEPRGFTLIEMMAVIGIIALLAAIILPTAVRLFSASSHEQARQMLSASLTGARAAAIEHAEYRIVHVQVGKDGSTWVCPMRRPAPTPARPAPRFGSEGIIVPYRLPGHIAFGGIAERFLVPAGDKYKPNLTDLLLEDFTSFSVGFSADGTVITDIDGAAFALDAMAPMFGRAKQAIWEECPHPEYGVRAVTYFSYPELRVLPAIAAQPNEITRTEYLNDNAQFLALNPLTGRVMDAK